SLSISWASVERGGLRCARPTRPAGRPPRRWVAACSPTFPSRSTSGTSTISSRSPSRLHPPAEVTSSPRRREAPGERYVVIGATGQLGSDLVRNLDQPP